MNIFLNDSKFIIFSRKITIDIAFFSSIIIMFIITIFWATCSQTEYNIYKETYNIEHIHTDLIEEGDCRIVYSIKKKHKNYIYKQKYTIYIPKYCSNIVINKYSKKPKKLTIYKCYSDVVTLLFKYSESSYAYDKYILE